MIIHDLMFDVDIVIGIGIVVQFLHQRLRRLLRLRRIMMRRVVVWRFFGSNPHSNGDLFSRSSLNFFGISVVNSIMAVDNRMVNIADVMIIIITCFSQIS